MEEEYRIIKGFENYSVSNFGNIKNNKTNRILKQSVNSRGYKHVTLNDKKNQRVHRLVALTFIPNLENKKCVDHINNDKTNNNVNNLRYVTIQQNNFNQKLSSKNTSGIKGISYYVNINKYRAQIQFNGKSYHLGYFETIEEAKEARIKKANELFGEYTNACEKQIIINIPKNKKIKNINIEFYDDEYKALEQEFENLIK